MTAYYNEHDPKAAAWLRELIKAGAIAPGDVDERSIVDVSASDVRGYTQCHWFAGVGVWSYSLRRAGWRDDQRVWSASLPCQPFSAAGKGLGFDDERHLWPVFYDLLRQSDVPACFGEQVASKAVNDWLDVVLTDLEALEFIVGAIAFPSAGVGAPHIRDRTYWVADAGGLALASSQRREGQRLHVREGQPRFDLSEVGRCSEVDGLADANSRQRDGQPVVQGLERDGADTGWSEGRGESESRSELLGLADANHARLEGRSGVPERTGQCVAGPLGMGSGVADAESQRRDGGQDTTGPRGRACIEADGPADSVDGGGRPGPVNGFWRDADWLFCRDGKWRPLESGTQPLVNGTPGDLGSVCADKYPGSRQTRLKGYGNAVNAEAARVWIETCMEVV